MQPNPAVPHYEIQWVCNEGPPGPIEMLPITKPPWDAESDRRGVRESIIGRMERHGGHADIRSEPGAGTEVELKLPLGEAHP